MLTFVHISDTHITFDEHYTQPYASYPPLLGARRLVEAVNALPFTPDFILHTGDIAYDPFPEVYPGIAALFEQFKAPVWYVAGNHDDRAAVQTVLQGVRDPLPFPYSEREINGVQVLLVDSNAVEPYEQPAGRVSDEQIAWLDAKCSADDDRPLVIAVHHNVVPVGVRWFDEFMGMRNGEAFHAAVRQARDRLRGVFHGHVHQAFDVLRDGVLYSAGSSSWCGFLGYPLSDFNAVIADPGFQPGFSVVHVTAQRTTIRRHTFSVAN
jgi:Icc protein